MVSRQHWGFFPQMMQMFRGKERPKDVTFGVEGFTGVQHVHAITLNQPWLGWLE